MTTLLEIRDAEKHYGEKILLDEATVAISDQFKVGLVGRNGSGKSTLCRIVLGEEELDAGQVIRHPRLRLGYLRQHDPFHEGETVLDFLQRDSGEPDWRCGQVAGEFAIRGEMLEHPVDQLSGGWQTRVKLAALLLGEPNLLLLDEPTNFLDLRTQLLLEAFLRDFRGACLIVSHDLGFLKATCGQTLELSRGRLTLFPGDVEAFIEHQAERRQHDQRVNVSIRAKRRQLETFIAKNRANANTASQARSKAKQLARLQTQELPPPEPLPKIRVPEVSPRRGPALRCVDLVIGYADHVVARDVNVEVEHGSRVAIVGDNGQGKTTFLRTATGSLTPLGGEVRWGYGCEIGTYAQHVYQSLPKHWTVEEYLTDRAAEGVKTQTILDIAGSFLFRGDDVKKPIHVLSGGERARLCLAGLLLGRHNVLVLDEPVNHLDVETVEALCNSLLAYRGTLLFSSHDRHFMHRVATAVVEVRDGGVAVYPDDYDHYLYRIRQETAAGLRELRSAGRRKTPDPPHRGSGRKPANGKVRQERRKELASIERQVARLDQEKKTRHEKLLAATDPDEAERLHAELSELIVRLETMEQRWFELNEQIADD